MAQQSPSLTYLCFTGVQGGGGLPGIREPLLCGAAIPIRSPKFVRSLVAHAVPSRMPSLRTANCFVPYNSTKKIYKSPQSNSLRNTHISGQQQKGFVFFCFQYHQTSTLGRPFFHYCNRIPQLCYLRSRV